VTGWDVKPTFLLSQLADGAEEVVWIDADVILASDFRPLIENCTYEELAVTEEHYFTPYPGGSFRTELWGLEVGRTLSNTLNSGFLRVTNAHRELLEAWEILLSNEGYAEAQKRTDYERPLHMWGDQDVLTALVGSTRFSNIPLRILKRGKEALTMTTPAGYTVSERLGNLGGKIPPIIHPVSPKPWSAKGRYQELAAELSPYNWAAEEYLHLLDPDDYAPCLEVHSPIGRVCEAVTFGDPALRGMPQAFFHTVCKQVKTMLGKGHQASWPTERAHVEPIMEPDGEALLGSLGYNQPEFEVG